MFHDIPALVLARMRELEQMDVTDRADGTGHFEQLRQVPPETGRFLAIAAAAAPDGNFIEIGTSAGYSGLWISLACRARGTTLTTFEVSPIKIGMATETFEKGGVSGVVQIVPGDVREHLADQTDVSFCFLDTEKSLYLECYDIFAPNLVKGALLAADNIISHKDDVQAFLDRVQADERMDAVVVPVGSGLLLARRV